jgi:hypothetical protein
VLLLAALVVAVFLFRRGSSCPIVGVPSSKLLASGALSQPGGIEAKVDGNSRWGSKGERGLDSDGVAVSFVNPASRLRTSGPISRASMRNLVVGATPGTGQGPLPGAGSFRVLVPATSISTSTTPRIGYSDPSSRASGEEESSKDPQESFSFTNPQQVVAADGASRSVEGHRAGGLAKTKGVQSSVRNIFAAPPTTIV